MTIKDLRATHPTFTYQSFDIDQAGDMLKCTFHFHLEPNIDFAPTIEIPLPNQVDQTHIQGLVFNLGLVEAISYWKATCSPKLIVEAGQLNTEQQDFWQHLFLHGLGEFYYVNQIDFTPEDFLTITCTDSAPSFPKTPDIEAAGDLVMVGGGKDSVVSMELLRDMPQPKQVLLVNPTIAATQTTTAAGYTNPIVVKRTLDPKLLELNQQGYLNGHTPFSALLAFLGTLVGYVHEHQHLIASNEASANEPSLTYKGLDINHQYSKSYNFETKFRAYASEHLTDAPEYFSLLRPLDELTIAKLFAQNQHYDQIFSSCNVARNDGWCGACPKCAFVYLMMSAVMEPSRIQTIFGKDLFDIPEIQTHIRALVTPGQDKPLDCIGTEAESQQAVHDTIAIYQAHHMTVPSFLTNLANKIPQTNEIPQASRSTYHHVPSEYVTLIKKVVAEKS